MGPGGRGRCFWVSDSCGRWFPLRPTQPNFQSETRIMPFFRLGKSQTKPSFLTDKTRWGGNRPTDRRYREVFVILQMVGVVFPLEFTSHFNIWLKRLSMGFGSDRECQAPHHFQFGCKTSSKARCRNGQAAISWPTRPQVSVVEEPPHHSGTFTGHEWMCCMALSCQRSRSARALLARLRGLSSIYSDRRGPSCVPWKLN